MRAKALAVALITAGAIHCSLLTSDEGLVSPPSDASDASDGALPPLDGGGADVDASAMGPSFQPPVVLADGLKGAGSLDVDGKSVFFADIAGGEIRAVDKSAPRVVRTVATISTAGEVWLHQDGAYLVYLARLGSPCSALVDRVDKNGGATTSIFGSCPGTDLKKLHGDRGQYFVTGRSDSDATKSYVAQVQVEGGGSLVSDGVPATVESVVAAGAYVVWSDPVSGTVSRFTRPSGPVEAIASQQAGPRDLATDDAYVYWVETSGSIRRVAYAADGGAPETLARNQDTPRFVRVSGEFVYWVEASGAGNVSRVAKAGGDVETLATGVRDPGGLVADASGVYWTSRGDGTVVAMFGK